MSEIILTLIKSNTNDTIADQNYSTLRKGIRNKVAPVKIKRFPCEFYSCLPDFMTQSHKWEKFKTSPFSNEIIAFPELSNTNRS